MDLLKKCKQALVEALVAAKRNSNLSVEILMNSQEAPIYVKLIANSMEKNPEWYLLEDTRDHLANPLSRPTVFLKSGSCITFKDASRDN